VPPTPQVVKVSGVTVTGRRLLPLELLSQLSLATHPASLAVAPGFCREILKFSG
jgi:hypothetical protein